jgi:hypothetical protein
MSQNVPPEKDVVLAVALASGMPIGTAADHVGIDRRTVNRKLADPDFRRQVAEFRGQLIATALGRMAENMTRAADAVAALLDDPDPALRLRAARTLFTCGLRLHDAVDLGDRVSDVEAELARREDLP